MEKFIESISQAQCAQLMKFLVAALKRNRSEEELRELAIAFHEAVAKFLQENLPEEPSEGFYEYVFQTAWQIIDGLYDSLDDIEKELAELRYEASIEKD